MFEGEGEGDDLSARLRFDDLLEEVASHADAEADYDFEGGPGQSSTYRYLFGATPERVHLAVAVLAQAWDACRDVHERGRKPRVQGAQRLFWRTFESSSASDVSGHSCWLEASKLTVAVASARTPP